MAESSTAFTLPSGFTIRPATPKDRWAIITLSFDVFDSDSFLQSIIQRINFSLASFFSIFLVLFWFFANSIMVGHYIEKFARDWLWKHNGYFTPYNFQNNFVRIWQNNAYLIGFILTTTVVCLLIFIETKGGLPGGWIVECDRRIVAFAKLSCRLQYSEIIGLYVAPRYRQRGLGSCLVQKLIQEANKPVCLTCLPELVRFYDRFGFIRASKENVPPHLRFLLNNNQFDLLTLFIPDPAASPVAVDEVDLLPEPTNRSYLIRQAESRDAKKIQQLIFNSSNFDIFLPFGVRLKIIYLLVGLATQLLILLLIVYFFSLIIIQNSDRDGNGIASQMKKYETYRWMGENLSKLAISCVTGLFLLMFIAFISRFLASRQYRNFWIAERNGKIIGYARLSRWNQYCILHYLHIDSEHITENLDRQLLYRMSETVRKPIYLACPTEFSQRYKRCGFVPVFTQNLPKNLRFGGMLNRQFGGSNLVLR